MLTKEESYEFKSKVNSYENKLKLLYANGLKIDKNLIDIIRFQRNTDVFRNSFAYLDEQIKKVCLLRKGLLQHEFSKDMENYFFVVDVIDDYIFIYKSKSGIIDLPKETNICLQGKAFDDFYALTYSEFDKINENQGNDILGIGEKYSVRTFKINRTSTPKTTF